MPHGEAQDLTMMPANATADSLSQTQGQELNVQAAPPQRSLYEVCWGLKHQLDAFLKEEAPTKILRNVQAQLRTSTGVVEEALRKYKKEQISLSYNGGKDCLVLLIVLLACLAPHLPPPPPPSSPSTVNGTSSSLHATTTKIQSVYIVSPHPFQEVDDFVSTSARTYHLEVLTYHTGMKKGLEAYLADRPEVKAIFVGTRRTDPHGANLTHFDMTDEGWPSFMRIHPVIDWKYAEIWAFVKHLEIPYCPLYDQGYTSLGGTKDTHPNPQLKKGGDDGFKPAYELFADDEERLGRDR